VKVAQDKADTADRAVARLNVARDRAKVAGDELTEARAELTALLCTPAESAE